MEIGHIIAKQRTKMGLSQKDLADKLNVSPAAVGLWEINKRCPSFNMLIDIADFFNVSMDFLFSADRKNYSVTNTESETALPEEFKKIIEYYGLMNEESKEILLGEARKLLRQQRLEEKNIIDRKQMKAAE